VRVVVLERNATTSNEPKAISLDDEALRTYQAAARATCRSRSRAGRRGLCPVAGGAGDVSPST
jgi:hypothetical protein